MVMPLYDDNPLKLPRLPLVTWGLIVANVVVFALEALRRRASRPTFDAFGVAPAT